MKVYRRATVSALACAGALSLAACSGGISSIGSAPAGSTSSAPPAATTGANSPVAASTASAGSTSSAAPASGSGGGTVNVGGSLGTFPIPPGANVLESNNGTGQISIAFNGVTASAADSFYTSALPQAGYTITENSSATGGSDTAVTIKFTGHGYDGDIGALSGTGTFNGISIGGTSGSAIGVTLTPQS